MIPHTRTDPMCIAHRPPKGVLSRWWFDLRRGKSCDVCRWRGRVVWLAIDDDRPPTAAEVEAAMDLAPIAEITFEEGE